MLGRVLSFRQHPCCWQQRWLLGCLACSGQRRKAKIVAPSALNNYFTSSGHDDLYFQRTFEACTFALRCVAACTVCVEERRRVVHNTQPMPCPISCRHTTSPHVYRADNGDGHAPPLPREELEPMPEAARCAPTHKPTPLRFARHHEHTDF